ncbi:hypothetical protein CWS01_20465 [Niallia nealsonii]|uniref:Nucleotidase n=1 Tax=Niallia nealsonii TaxID=115979 RepID=A0A2N0YX49_9BACI|nr:hypothetical protein CWS01_20465 [Niallia nealsonii]
MKFGFDIDDTLINLREYAFGLYNKKLQKNIDLEIFKALKTVEIHHPFGLQDVEGKELWNSLREEIYFTDCPPFPMAVETLNELVKSGHDVYYITARNKEFGERTKEWMQRQGFPMQEGHFYCGMEDHEKIHIIKKLELDFYFDDKPQVVETLADTVVQVYVKDHPYNQEVKMNRLKDWSELASILKK